MAKFEFTTKTRSSVLRIDNGSEFSINNMYSISILHPENKTLRVNKKFDVVRTFNINVDEDSITIDSIPFVGTTAEELYDLLEGLFFLGDFVKTTDYSQPTIGGTLKSRLDGDVLYLTNNGQDA